MNIHINQFCYLATAPLWLAWLNEYSTNMYVEFVEAVQQSSGCRAQSDLMRQTLDRIIQTPGGEDQLESFLRKNFPHVLTQESIKPVGPLRVSTRPNDPVFGQFDPDLLTIPRRKIIKCDDPVELRVQMDQLLHNKPSNDYIILGNTAYIEYLPNYITEDQVPAAKWLTKRWRNLNQFK